MKKFLKTLLSIVLSTSILVIPSFAYRLGGATIYDSNNNNIGGAMMWNTYNTSTNLLYTLNGEMTSTKSATLTIVLNPEGMNLETKKIELIGVSVDAVSYKTYFTHSYAINPDKYIPTLAKGRFIINGTNNAQIEHDWTWDS